MNVIIILIWIMAVVITVLIKKKQKGDKADFFLAYVVVQGVSLLISPLTFCLLFFSPAMFLPVYYCFLKPRAKYQWRLLAILCIFLSVGINYIVIEHITHMHILQGIMLLFICPVLVMFPLGVASYIETYRRVKLKK